MARTDLWHHTCHLYHLGEDFDLKTDDKCLRWLMVIVDPSGRLIRWGFRLSEYEFVIHQKKGRNHTPTGAVFRLLSNGHTTEPEHYALPSYSLSVGPLPSKISQTELLREQHAEPSVGR